MQILNWTYNPEKKCVDLIVDKGEGKSIETVTIELQESMLIDISAMVPALSEKQKMEEHLRKIYALKEKQLLTFDELCNKMNELEEEHSTVRDELSQGNLTKEDILALTSRSKDLVGVKALFTEKRHMVKWLGMEEAKLRAELAKMQAGY